MKTISEQIDYSVNEFTPESIGHRSRSIRIEMLKRRLGENGLCPLMFSQGI
jgi:hypothetical protein